MTSAELSSHPASLSVACLCVQKTERKGFVFDTSINDRSGCLSDKNFFLGVRFSKLPVLSGHGCCLRGEAIIENTVPLCVTQKLSKYIDIITRAGK